MSGYGHVFSEQAIGPLTIPNRVVRTAHSTRQPWGSDDLIAYHVARARGGVGLSILGAASVHPSSPVDIPAYDDGVIPGYEKLAAAFLPYDTRLMQQLWHAGSVRTTNPLGGPPWSASAVMNPVSGTVPRPMTQQMIDDVVAGFGSAARRVRDGGLDGVEVHAGHSYLIAQFLSPMTNRRDDRYGGDLDNRTRLLREVLAAIRESVGPDFPVGVRISSDEEVPGGLTPTDMLEVARKIEPLVDFVSVSIAGYYRFDRIMATADGSPTGYEIPSSEQITRSLSVPTIVAGRIQTLDHAEHLIESGVADMVSMVRALIADPDLVVNSRAGNEQLVRPCLGTNEGCIGGRFDNAFGCVVNPAAGNETRWTSPPRSNRPRRVLVVGGGPAGLEAAREAAMRGHSVSLFELTNRLGGQVAIAARAPHRAEYGAHVAWLEAELRRLGVRVRLRTAGEPDVIASEAPDVLVVATGSTPRRDGFSAARPAVVFAADQQARVLTSWDVLLHPGDLDVGPEAVVTDNVGGFEAISTLEALLAQGGDVTLVTRHDTFGTALPYPLATVAAARARLLANERFRLVTNAVVRDLTHDTAEVEWLQTARTEWIPASSFAAVGANEANRELADVLTTTFDGAVHVIGDAAYSTTMREAIAQGAETGRSL